MRRVEFNPGNLIGDHRSWWDAWQRRATAATNKVTTEWETWLEKWLKKRDPLERCTFHFNDKIWSDLKEWMVENLFYRRCAYCETGMVGFWGDAEHHRPKGNVSGRDAEGTSMRRQAILEIGAEEIQIAHPGYFWLAYNWRNLIPSCQWCNQGGGKVDQYPTDKVPVVMKRLNDADAAALQQPIRSTKWPTSYYLGPSDLDFYEHPSLLNPLNPESAREPLKHLRFGVLGEIAAVGGSAIGTETIRVLRLDDGARTESREKAQRNIHQRYYIKYADPDHTDEDLDRLLEPYRKGKEDYSVAALEYLTVRAAKARPLAPSFA
jgi:hypothetical protein